MSGLSCIVKTETDREVLGKCYKHWKEESKQQMFVDLSIAHCNFNALGVISEIEGEKAFLMTNDCKGLAPICLASMLARKSHKYQAVYDYMQKLTKEHDMWERRKSALFVLKYFPAFRRRLGTSLYMHLIKSYL